MKKISLILLIFQLSIFTQSENILRDTSYTPYTTYVKEVKKNPFIKIVNPILPDNVNAIRNIEYVTYSDRSMNLDLFFTDSYREVRPGVILVHGGGWQTGDKSHMFPMALELATKGFVTACIQYRLSSEAIFPAAVIDIKNSIKWLKQNSITYNIDTNKIAILGCSAGGQLAALVGYASVEENFETNEINGVASNVQAVINIDGLMDFLGEGSKEFDEVPDSNNPRAVHKWLGYSHLENPGLWSKVSPISYINELSIPIIFINSSVPRFHAGRDEAVEMLKIFGIYHEVHTIENTPHSFWLFHPWFNTTFNLVLNFLEILFGKN